RRRAGSRSSCVRIPSSAGWRSCRAWRWHLQENRRRRSRMWWSRRRGPDTVCVAAILKDEDRFVEEWVAYHRLLGVDHFYLYDNDPRQPLRDILAAHRDYVTVREWLIDHDDRRYPGRTKQTKAYTHCL